MEDKRLSTGPNDAEGTYTVDLFLTHSDGDPVQGATYKLIDQTGATFEGTLDNSGKASVGGVALA
ncbi:hypothetical protein [Vibrio bivalvicida]|uniref:Big-1 domain-containing protein n=1 Tax=Vibrio bivalvicida TaxID=1276888 RepID=A0A177XXI6_9VIBR|nr:hypothetical protein [Vibrio bivalvicida]OAJ93066.1 hypothetical protein APB76_17880 [Vibrio bivalvicida]